ncbi:MAG: peptidoglycan DD-metalloendopeptidase family protein [Lachnospiraceae bacterium]|nr:peptidoglycan DD-metalloendopeptidase family protein [Lachnospiraceae bacterium]MCI9397600.1 peptidoglycan DD-metalloendopeptidase family protein [Lachnospiraceae bacterium]
MTGVVLCLALVLSCVAPAPTVQAVTSESIREKEREIEKAKEEVSGLKSNLTDVEKLKKELEQSKNDLTAFVQQLDGQLADIQEKIAQYNTMISDKEKEIEETLRDLDEAQARQEQQYAAMKKRIQFMYERSDSFYMETLFGTNSIAGIVNRADYIEALSRYDRDKLNEYVETRKYVELCKEELEVEKQLLDEAREAVEQEEANVNSLIGEKEAQIVSVSGDIANKEAAIKEYEDMIAQENAEIAALEKAVAEEKARLEAENAQARVYNGGMFAWPCPGYKRISDEYGSRMHPILGVEKFHNGLDMAAPSGTAILAAYDGDVVAAAYSGSMGNYIMIDHGSGLYTIYMHCSALYVSKGQSVSKGQNIAAVGSTGRSTGPHLHFGVRLNGNYTSPWNYLK